MTAFALNLQRNEALIASDTIVYTARSDPVGFMDKVFPLARLRAAFFGRGVGVIGARAAAALAVAYQCQTLEEAALALPDVLRDLTEEFADAAGLDDPGAHLVFEGRLIGWSGAERRIRLFAYENYNDNFAQQEPGLGLGWIASPAIPAEFQPAAAKGLTLERQAIEIMRAHKRVFDDQEARGITAPCLGGEVMLTRVSERGVDAKSIWTFPNAAEQGHAAAAVAARALRGDYEVDLNEDLGKVANGIGERRHAPPSADAGAQPTRQQRHAAERASKRAA